MKEAEMPTGAEMYDLAQSRDGERYVNICIPKNDPNWHGPWDCAEFMSWLVYQVSGRLYGCIDNQGDPATVEAYTGAWKRDSQVIGRRVPWRQAAAIRGGILLRYPPAAGKMGHIAICDGRGRTMEAMGVAYGVRHGEVDGRVWHTGVLVPGIDYDEDVALLAANGPAVIYGEGIAGLDRGVVRRIQDALLQKGVDPGPLDGIFGAKTAAAVATFQGMRGLISDGLVGPQTAAALGISI